MVRAAASCTGDGRTSLPLRGLPMILPVMTSNAYNEIVCAARLGHVDDSAARRVGNVVMDVVTGNVIDRLATAALGESLQPA